MWWTLLWGCAEPTAPVPGIQIGELGDDLPCREVRVEVARPDTPVAGWKVPPARLVDTLDGVFPGTFTFADGRTASLTSDHRAVSVVRFVTQEPLYAEAKIMCDGEWFEVDAEWRLEAAELSVYTRTMARMDRPGSVTMFVRVPGEVGRPLTPQRLDTEETYLALGIRTDEDGWFGSVTWEGAEQGYLVDAETLGSFVIPPAL